MSINQARLRRLNDAPVRREKDYVLYWMQMARRLRSNHALDYAARVAEELSKPLVIYEGLRLDYPWASARLHTFILQGMRDNAVAAKRAGLNYWPFVETRPKGGRGLLKRLASRACCVVTDDFPCFIIPAQSRAVAEKIACGLFAVDANAVVPLSLLGDAPYAAAHLRPRIHRLFAEAYAARSSPEPRFSRFAKQKIDVPFETPGVLFRDVGAFVATLPIDQSVTPVSDRPGGSRAADTQLRSFVESGLPVYADHRSEPMPPEALHGSRLSPFLHFGHVAIEDVVGAVFDATGGYKTDRLQFEHKGKREGFFGTDRNANSFLDEALTWRDVGYVWHRSRHEDTASLEKALPKWALATLGAHGADRRAYEYRLEQWERAETHDPLWNAAQRELVATGSIHNYLRMLWGKKVIEWSRTPGEAYATLVHLNNKYALDGRNPNSYTGILWCFGLFDRPWAPERPVLGQIRYMSSENTARKFKLGPYLDWVATLGGGTSP
jgi:deoxyribodipyrimidine photo-lyase